MSKRRVMVNERGLRIGEGHHKAVLTDKEVEQLIAESTGKHGKGIVPIAGEPLGDQAIAGRRHVAEGHAVVMHDEQRAEALRVGVVPPLPRSEPRAGVGFVVLDSTAALRCCSRVASSSSSRCLIASAETAAACGAGAANSTLPWASVA